MTEKVKSEFHLPKDLIPHIYMAYTLGLTGFCFSSLASQIHIIRHRDLNSTHRRLWHPNIFELGLP